MLYHHLCQHYHGLRVILVGIMIIAVIRMKLLDVLTIPRALQNNISSINLIYKPDK